MTTPRVLILGANGRLGGILRRQWRGACPRPLWQVRTPNAQDETIAFDPLNPRDALPRLRGRIDVVLGLAGVTPGRGDLALNTALARATVEIGAQIGAARVFVTSSAAVYGPSDRPLREDTSLRPQSDYGRAKAAMEDALRDCDMPLTILRIGNVAGADALLGVPGSTRILDRFADGQGPRRSYIGPATLADVLARLMEAATKGTPLPRLLNIAEPGALAMADLCHAAGFTVTWQLAPETALPCVELDVSRLSALVPLAPAEPARMVADWRADRGMA